MLLATIEVNVCIVEKHLDSTGSRSTDGSSEAMLIPNKLVPGHRFSRDLLSLDGHEKLIPFTQHHLRLRAPYAEAFPKRTVTWRLPHKYSEPAAKEVILLMEEIHGYITNGWTHSDRRQAV